VIPRLRAHFEELGIKPKNVFARGLFVSGRAGRKLVRGGLLPQGRLKDSAGSLVLSDDVLGASLSLIGFGQDAEIYLDAETRTALAAAGGEAVQIAHCGQRLHRTSANVWEDLDGTFLPGVAPFGWAAVVRPDRTVVHDGPVFEAGRLVRESLALLGAPLDAAAESAGADPHFA
jgi:3-(3-hydroxy-phenyl)propionate hydroxylase